MSSHVSVKLHSFIQTLTTQLTQLLHSLANKSLGTPCESLSLINCKIETVWGQWSCYAVHQIFLCCHHKSSTTAVSGESGVCQKKVRSVLPTLLFFLVLQQFCRRFETTFPDTVCSSLVVVVEKRLNTSEAVFYYSTRKQ